MTLILTVTVIIFALYDSFVINRYDNLKGWKKAFHIALLGVALGIVIALFQKFNVRNMLICLPFTLALVWLVKDAIMGFIMAMDIFYLGSGWWDSLWKQFPGGLLLILKLIFLGFGIHLMYFKL
jgi:hypothetical protein